MTRAVNTALAGSGGVLQVVNATTQTTTSTTSQSFVATTITATITPTSSTSRIVVQAIFPFVSNNTTGPGVAIYRNGVVSYNPSAQDSGGRYYYAYGAAIYTPVTLSYIDSPATTSATTYTVYISSYNATATISAPFLGNVNNATASITLTEIAG